MLGKKANYNYASAAVVSSCANRSFSAFELGIFNELCTISERQLYGPEATGWGGKIVFWSDAAE